MRYRTLRSILCAVLMAWGSSALAQEPEYQPQDPPSPSPSPSAEPSPGPSPSPAPAPQPAKPIVAMVRAVPQRLVFVGDEPVTVVYHVVAATGVSVDPEPLSKLGGQFRIQSFTVGELAGIPGVKDLHVQRVTLIVQFPAATALGTYELPGTKLRFSQDIVVEKDGNIYRTPAGGTVAVAPVKLEKVAVYVETDLLHEVTFLGDENRARLTVHLGPEAELLNEYPPKGAPAPAGVTYLSTFKPGEPFASLGIQGVVTDSGTYRITEYSYLFSTLDIGPKPFPFAYPSVQVRRRDDAKSQIKVIAPNAVNISVRPRVDRRTPAEPLKGAVADPTRERLLLWQLPVTIGVVLTAYLALTGITSFIGWVRFRKVRRRRRPAVIDEEPQTIEPVYETGWFRRRHIRAQARVELDQYNSALNRSACERLRAAAARLLAAHLEGSARIDRVRAQALPAATLAVTTPTSALAYWRDILIASEQCLERNTYVPITGSTGGGYAT